MQRHLRAAQQSDPTRPALHRKVCQPQNTSQPTNHAPTTHLVYSALYPLMKER